LLIPRVCLYLDKCDFLRINLIKALKGYKSAYFFNQHGQKSHLSAITLSVGQWPTNLKSLDALKFRFFIFLFLISLFLIWFWPFSKTKTGDGNFWGFFFVGCKYISIKIRQFKRRDISQSKPFYHELSAKILKTF
jgi:hypothetical protein